MLVDKREWEWGWNIGKVFLGVSLVMPLLALLLLCRRCVSQLCRRAARGQTPGEFKQTFGRFSKVEVKVMGCAAPICHSAHASAGEARVRLGGTPIIARMYQSLLTVVSTALARRDSAVDRMHAPASRVTRPSVASRRPMISP